MGFSTVVPAPPATPPVYGLVTSARLPNEADDRWIRGFGYEPEACGTSSTAAICTTDNDKSVEASDAELLDYVPYVVWAGDMCTTIAQRDRRGRAQRLLLACESKTIARELWKGEVAQAESLPNKYLASSDTEVVGGSSTEVALRDALAGMEEYLAACSCGGRSMIHVTTITATLLAGAQLVRREGDLLYTILNTIVVPDAGYDGSSPDGEVDGTGATAWMYGTGLVDVRRSSIDVLGVDNNSGINRANNDWTVIAERAAAATFDPCCLGGINVDLRERG